MCFLAISSAIPNNITLAMFLLLVHKIFVQIIINSVDHDLYLEMKCKHNMMSGTGRGQLDYVDDAWQHGVYYSDLDHHAAFYWPCSTSDVSRSVAWQHPA